MTNKRILTARSFLSYLLSSFIALFFTLSALIISGCATTAPKQQQVQPSISLSEQAAAQREAALPVVRVLKRKVAIGRFTNETRYGKTFQVDSNSDPLGKQASDMLASRLVASQKFMVLERPDLNKIQAEQSLSGAGDLVGADALIVGSITEFGRSTTGKTGFLSATKVQTAHAKVEIRLVDVRTGYVFFTASGSGDASTESGEIAGYGNKADYDATLNDRAIGAALSDLQSALISKLEERPWRTDILKIEGSTVYISGGASQGIKVGDNLSVMQTTQSVKSGQTGFTIELPPKSIGKIKVTGLFGSNEINEGSIAEVSSGNFAGMDKSTLFVSE